MTTATKKQKKPAAKKPAAKKQPKATSSKKTPATAVGKPKGASLQLVKLTEVEIQKGHNPRGSINERSETFKGLVSSIKELGVLQPLLVGPKLNGSFSLIDGERRLRAARKAKAREIPVHEVANLDEFYAALVANMEREDLSPLEEAGAIARLQDPGEGKKGLTQPQIAKRLRRSERWVRNRANLLALPDKVQKLVDAGELTIEGAQKLAQVAKKSPELAAAIAANADPGDLEDDWRLANIAKQVAKKAGYLTLNPGYRGVEIKALPLSPAAKKEITAKAKPLSEYDRSIDLDSPADISAQRKAGNLLELPGPHGAKAYFVEIKPAKDWIEKTARKRLEKKLKDRAKQKRSTDTAATKTAAEERKRQQEAEDRKLAKEREQKHALNLMLGEGLRKAGRPKLTADVARLLVVLALDHEEIWAQDLATKLAITRDDRHEVTEIKGGLKVEVDENSAVLQLFEDLRTATTAEGIIGIGLQVLMALHFADAEVISSGNRMNRYRWPDVTGGLVAYDVGEGDDVTLLDTRGLLERIALDLGVLPDSLRKGAEQDLEERAKQAEAEEAERKKEQLAAELRVLMELEAAGGEKGDPVGRAQLLDACAESKGSEQPHHLPFHAPAVDAAVERLVENRQVSQVETEEGGVKLPELKINPSGAARIEKAG